MTDLLIPFGIHRDTGAVVEPEDAPKGRACDCLCPGCKAPLLSRHPKEKRYHFAHDSRHDNAKPEEECPFSSAVAVAMMVREIAVQAIGKEFKTPPLRKIKTFNCCGEHKVIDVTRGAINIISGVQVSEKVFDHHADVVVKIGTHRILVDLVYKGKPPVAIEEEMLQENSAALLELDCDNFSISTFKNDRNLRFSESVLAFLLNDGARSWRFHPKTTSALRKVGNAHRCRKISFRPTIARSNYRPIESNKAEPAFFEKHIPDVDERRLIRYQCVLCGEQWTRDLSRDLQCPNGHSHLYANEIG